MSQSFNLIDESWIPCIFSDGRRGELGLREALSRAHEIREILDDSPLVTAALHRLLLAVLHRNFGPASTKEWIELYRRKQFDSRILDAYWEKWKHRFDLFDPDWPFYQSAILKTKKVSTIARIKLELACQNNDTLFDHSIDDAPMPSSYAEAARYLIAFQGYALSGRLESGYPSSGTLFSGALVLLEGETLAETLLLNLIIYNPKLDKPIQALDDDLPAWESSDCPVFRSRNPKGWLDYLTWQSRSLLLIPGSEDRKISSILVDAGFTFPETMQIFDPQMAYRKIEKVGWRPYQFDIQKSLWRNSASLFDFKGEVNKSPATLFQLRNVSSDESIGDKKMMVLGWCCDKAKIHQWRHERFPLPMDYLNREDLVVSLENALRTSEEFGKMVRQTIWSLARNLLSPWENMEKSPDKDAVSSLAKSFSAPAYFWSSLEPHFHELYTGIPTDSDAALERWTGALKDAAWEGLELTLRGLDDSARSLQAAVKARRFLGGSIKKLIPNKEEYARV